MVEATLLGLVSFGLAFLALMLVERLIHHLTRDADRSYRWGVWLFSILIGGYVFVTSLGR